MVPKLYMFNKQPTIIRKAFGSKAWVHVNAVLRGIGHLIFKCELGLLLGYSIVAFTAWYLPGA